MIVAKYANINLDLLNCEMGKSNKTAEYLAKFPFGKIPALEAGKVNLYESNAICQYLASQGSPVLLGSTAEEQALVQQFICSLDCELIPSNAKVVYPLLGHSEYEEKKWNADLESLMKKLMIYDGILSTKTFFVGESITLADIAIASTLLSTYRMVLCQKERAELVNLTRWFVTIVNQRNFAAVVGEVELAQKVAEIKKKCCAAAPAPAAAPASEEPEEVKPVEKTVNPMDLLPAPKMKMDDWKRYYSNANETRPDATNWFWEHYDPKDYSIWRADYKYPEELKRVFMTCNLITGLFARMERLRKYTFASVCIFGEDNKNEVHGYFVFRGTEIPELMKDVADFEVYDWTQMDTNDEAQRELFNDYLAWEGKFEGLTFNEGKIFK